MKSITLHAERKIDDIKSKSTSGPKARIGILRGLPMGTPKHALDLKCRPSNKLPDQNQDDRGAHD